ncbi:MAG: serine hydrolase [Thermomicrobiales bacterium]
MENSSERNNLEHQIQNIADSFSGDLSFAAKNIDSGEEISYNADQILPSASTIKVTILAELFRQAREEGLDLSSRLDMQQSDIVGGSGILKELGPGLSPSLMDLATLMIIVSDNTATNMLIDRVGGVERVNETMDAYGLSSLRLHSRVDFEHIGNDVRRFAEGTAAGFMQFGAMLLEGEMVDAPSSASMIEILDKQQYLDQVPRFLNVFPGAKDINRETAISVGCKTGFFPGTRVDAGVIRIQNGPRIAYCAMATGSSDLSIAAESEPAVVNGLLGRAMVEHWWPEGIDITPAVLDSPYVKRALRPAE